MKQKRRLSQVFLRDENVLEKIARAIPLKGKTVLEIGAGTGVLTSELAKRCVKVKAIEIDRGLAPALEKNLAGQENVEIVFGNALKTSFKGFKTVFGNLPYHIASPLLFKILESHFDEAVLLLQYEFALRLVAKGGSSDWSRLSVMTQARSRTKILFKVSRHCFRPVPKTDSAVVLLKRRKKPVELNADLVNVLFQHKNQTVRNALLHSRKFLGKNEGEIKDFVDSLEAKTRSRRVRRLSLQDLKKISEKWETAD